jgi:hypothetical protein
VVLHHFRSCDSEKLLNQSDRLRDLALAPKPDGNQVIGL